MLIFLTYSSFINQVIIYLRIIIPKSYQAYEFLFIGQQIKVLAQNDR